MAAITLPDGEELRDATSEDPLVIGDISGCGSGRLIVDIARRLREVDTEALAIYRWSRPSASGLDPEAILRPNN